MTDVTDSEAPNEDATTEGPPTGAVVSFEVTSTRLRGFDPGAVVTSEDLTNEGLDVEALTRSGHITRKADQ